MRRALTVLALLLIAGLALAGRTDQVGVEPRVIWQMGMRDTSVDTGQSGAPCMKGMGGIQASSDDRIKCFIPKGESLWVTHTGLIVSGTVQTCTFKLEYGTISDGDDSSVYVTDSTITVGEVFDCDGASVDLDANGESCRVRTEPTLLPEATWLQWEVTDAGGDCGSAQAVLFVYGEWIL